MNSDDGEESKNGRTKPFRSAKGSENPQREVLEQIKKSNMQGQGKGSPNQVWIGDQYRQPDATTGRAGTLAEIQNGANYLQSTGMAQVGRGVGKTQISPQQQNGLWPQNPQYFGVQEKPAIPYQKIVNDAHNLNAVMSGFQSVPGMSGAMPGDAASAIANATRRQSIISEAFNTKSFTSLYAGVPKNASVNLYQIQLNNARRDSLYAFQ